MARTDEHFIWTGDYAERINRLAAAVAAAEADIASLAARLKEEQDSDEPTLATESTTTAEELVEARAARDRLADDFRALRDEAEGAGLRVTLRGLSDLEWDEIVDKYPPRDEEQFAKGDRALGFNERKGARDFIRIALVDPEFSTRAKFDAWVAEKGLTRGDLAAMLKKAHILTNGMGYTDPKLLQSSQIPSGDVD